MALLSPEEALLQIKNHVREVSRDGNRTLRVKCDTAGYANGMIYTYAALFGMDNVNDAGFHFLNTDKYAYPRFMTNEMREQALAVTEALMNGETVTFISSGSISIGTTGGSTTVTTDPNPTVTVVSETETSKGFSLGSSVYIIIGAASIILVLLLWDRKKK